MSDAQFASELAAFNEYWEAFQTMLLANVEGYAPEDVFRLTEDAARHAWLFRALPK